MSTLMGTGLYFSAPPQGGVSAEALLQFSYQRKMVKSIGNLSGLGASLASGLELSHSAGGKGQGCGPQMGHTECGQCGPATQCELKRF